MESFELSMYRRDISENVTEIVSGEMCDRWLVIRRMLDASHISIQVSVNLVYVFCSLIMVWRWCNTVEENSSIFFVTQMHYSFVVTSRFMTF